MLVVSIPKGQYAGECRIDGRACEFRVDGPEFCFREADRQQDWDRRPIHSMIDGGPPGRILTTYCCGPAAERSRPEEAPGLEVTCVYNDAEVAVNFIPNAPGFSARGEADIAMRAGWKIDVGESDCDGLVAVRLGRTKGDGSPITLIVDSETAREFKGGGSPITLIVDSETAREFAAKLVTAADFEDAKLEEADESDEG